MVTWVEGVQGGAAIASVVYGYVQLSHKHRAEVKAMAYRWGSYIGCAAVGVASIIEIYKFGVSADPLTRKDVLWLLLNLWNAVAYIGCGIALAAIWHRMDKRKAEEPNADPEDKPQT